jgi:dipeptidyl aminopeptidase/acylaminoacyl peptidase
MPSKLRTIAAEDLYRFELITHCEIQPNGLNVIYALGTVDRATEEKVSHLWMASTTGGPPRQFTFGEQSDTTPRWSPDGKQIAFLSNRGQRKQTQIHVIPVDGGEARPITNMQGEFGGFEWSPDGKQIVVQFRKRDPDDLEREKDGQKKLGIVARHYDRVHYKLDGYGYLPKERWHLWLINSTTGKARQLTDHPVYDELEPAWSPDGSQIAFVSNRCDDPDLDPDVVDLFVASTTDGRIRCVETPLGRKSLPQFSPDGTRIAYFGREGRGDDWKSVHLYFADMGGKKLAQNLTGENDFCISSGTINDTGSPPQSKPTWSPDGRSIYFQIPQHGSTLLKAVSVEDRIVHDVVAEKGVVGAFTFDTTHSRLAYYFGTMSDPGQIMLREMASLESRSLTKLNLWLRKVDLGQVEEVWTKGADDNDLQGWILKPPGFRSDRKYPSILEIHGGPQTQYGNLLMHEFHYLAAKGFVVHFCNPRGGRGYGEEHTRAIWNDWGNRDYADLMAWTDHVSRRRFIDKKRMGVAGGSYGGFMTTWIIGHTDRFAGAVAQRVVSNLVSMRGSSDFNWDFQVMFGGKPPWEDLDNFWRMSPMKHIGQAKTPTLVIHSEQDMRCDPEQGEQVYVALKQLGVDTELVLFPDSPHGLSRSGRTDRRITRLGHIERWFAKYLK